MGCTSSKEIDSDPGKFRRGGNGHSADAAPNRSSTPAKKLFSIKRVDDIEEKLKRSQRSAQAVKLLLLGAGECGKSTVLKQMRLIHSDGFTNMERRQYTRIIWSDAVQSMKILLQNAPRLNIILDADSPESPLNAAKNLVLATSPFEEYEDDEGLYEALKDYFLEMESSLSKKKITEFDQYNDDVTDEEMKQAERAELANKIRPAKYKEQLAEAIHRLWTEDKGIQECYLQSNRFQLEVNAEHYFESIFKYANGDYLASDQDILAGRIKTTGISETIFQIRDTKFRMFDVGGQRSERRKWIHCFDNVTAVMYVVAVSEYDEKLYEDESVDRMVESLKLFANTINSPYFKDTPVILFLNKIDILERKLKTSPIKDYYPAYSGDPYSAEEVCEFMRQLYVCQNLNPLRQVYVHNTCATDTESMKFVIGAVTDMVFQKNILWSGLI